LARWSKLPVLPAQSSDSHVLRWSVGALAMPEVAQWRKIEMITDVVIS
jgi:hypothetical protein